MKYHPIEDHKYFSNRDYIGKHWNRKFIRTIQAILTSTKGKVGKGKEFFYKAFGSNEDEFYKLLYMQEAMIIYRLHFEQIGMTEKWWNEYSHLNDNEKAIVNPIIESNNFNNIDNFSDNSNIVSVLKYYQITRNEAVQGIKEL